jgi:outer membrane protein OmpA-like peptidoglycan-associated protein
MEMKKQVLSFTEFINEAYSMMVNEARTWDDVKTLLSDYIDDDTKKNLAYVEDLLSSDARPGVKANILALAGNTFSEIIAKDLDGTYTNIEEVNTTINQLEYDEVIQGSVFVNKVFPIGSDINLGGQSVGSFKEADGKMKLEDLLNLINIENMKKLSNTSPTSSKKGKGEFSNINKEDKQTMLWGTIGKPGEKRKIKGSGSQDQYYITKIESQIEIGKWTNENKVTPASGVEPVKMSMDVGEKYKENKGDLGGYKDKKLQRAGSANFTYVLYSIDPKSIRDGKNKGADKSISDIKEVKIPVKTPDITQDLVIQDNGVLFTKNTASLTDAGKKNIYNAITQNFTSVSEILIQGSASQEGDKKNNEKLCVDRAAAVEVYLKSITSANITASTTPSIQPATPVTDEAVRKTFRNVTLTVKGTKLVKGESSTKTIYIPTTGKVKCDKVTINELTMTFKVVIDPDKAKKRVDTEGNVKGRSARS